MSYAYLPPAGQGDFRVGSGKISRRGFVSSATMSLCLAACGGGDTGSRSYTLLSGTPQQLPNPSATPTSGAVPGRLMPGSSWTGQAGSGFNGATPSDPVRSTAKPVLRPLQPANLWFTDFLTLGVWSAALSDNPASTIMGIEKVILHYEGSKIEILAPTVQVMRDANGIERRYLGWWATIARPETVSGHAHVYWEAIPQNANLQRRVIGPFQYSPQPSLHDAMLTVTPSAGVVAGKSYQTISSALDWCAVNKRQNPLITITEPGTYDLAKINGLYQGEGYASIAASTPVTISLSPGGAGYYRPGYTGLHFVGQAITLDFVNATHFYAESVSNCNRPTWFDGCYLTCSAGSYSLVNKAPRNSLAALVRGRAIL